MQEHYTAWITTTPTELQGDTADVVVLRDEYAGERTGGNGQTIIEWTSTGSPLFHADLGIRHDRDPATITDAAEDVLETGGWEVIAPRWDPVQTGFVAEVEPIAAD